MQAKHSGLNRTASIFRAGMLACVLLISGRPSLASDCACGGNHGWSECSQTPRLEEFGGWSLFWHDPCTTPNYCWSNDWYCHQAAAPQLYAAVDFLPLFRDQAGWSPFQAQATRLATPAAVAGDPDIITYPREAVLSSSDLDSAFEPGVRALVGLSLSDWYRIEFSSFGLHSWSDSVTTSYNAADGTGNLLSPFSSFGDQQGRAGLDTLPDDGSFQPVEGLDFNEFAAVSYASRLNNAELNLRRRVIMPHRRYGWSEVSCLLGLRYMKVREDFGYDTESPLPDPGGGTQNTVDVRTGNNMFGVQLGALSQFLVLNRGWIDFEIKGALFMNDAESQIQGQVQGTDVMLIDDQDVTSFLTDLSLQFNYQFAPEWTIRVGYNAMWLSGVALASENFTTNATTMVGGTANLDDSGDVVYHGPNIGLIWAR